MRRGVTCFVVFKEKSLASALPAFVSIQRVRRDAREEKRRENFFSKTKQEREREKRKNVLFNILGWLLLCSIIRLSAFPFVSNDPTLLLLLVVLYIAPSPPPPPPPACISSSSSSSRWDSSTNRSMSRVGIDVFLSLCRRIFPKGTKKRVSGVRKKREALCAE